MIDVGAILAQLEQRRQGKERNDMLKRQMELERYQSTLGAVNQGIDSGVRGFGMAMDRMTEQDKLAQEVALKKAEAQRQMARQAIEDRRYQDEQTYRQGRDTASDTAKQDEIKREAPLRDAQLASVQQGTTKSAEEMAREKADREAITKANLAMNAPDTTPAPKVADELQGLGVDLKGLPSTGARDSNGNLLTPGNPIGGSTRPVSGAEKLANAVSQSGGNPAAVDAAQRQAMSQSNLAVKQQNADTSEFNAHQPKTPSREPDPTVTQNRMIKSVDNIAPPLDPYSGMNDLFPNPLDEQGKAAYSKAREDARNSLLALSDLPGKDRAGLQAEVYTKLQEDIDSIRASQP